MSAQIDPRPTDSPDSALDTYRALRVGMVGAGLLLLVAVAVEVARVDEIPGSISATFYSPVRGVFVASLLAVGLALVAIKGRPGWEDGLLNVAGALVPLVGFVPTPVTLSTIPGGTELPLTCPDPDEACVPTELAPDVANNVTAYLLLGAAGLAFVWVRLARARQRGEAWRPRTRNAVLAATGVWTAFGGWFLLGRASFLEWAHYTSAISFFVLLIVVVFINGRRAVPTVGMLGPTTADYRRRYYAVALAMAGAVVAGVVTFLVTGEQSGFPLVFWLELVLLVLYIVFWAMQTVEHWFHAIPPEVPQTTPVP
ncbi:hypothetical protein C8046_14125 [Serinibacter arcticus]|uniref:Uncharacterized protein n=1 Tax=Serinibacter arcticus TaxID=1655435 RepID=A0A2U1ZXE8_9MICO|nr:hypothetical protein [Serinibacter arcticus]PWD51613.1 hypothetical protein C8046_14125 [Serinibacter arcticus]